MVDAVDEVVEQSRLEWLQRRLLIAEEFRLRLAHAPSLLRVAVKGVVRHFLTARLFQIGRELVCVKTRALVIHEVLQMVGIPVRTDKVAMLLDLAPTLDLAGDGGAVAEELHAL